jgi:hypothetical protein
MFKLIKLIALILSALTVFPMLYVAIRAWIVVRKYKRLTVPKLQNIKDCHV